MLEPCDEEVARYREGRAIKQAIINANARLYIWVDRHGQAHKFKFMTSGYMGNCITWLRHNNFEVPGQLEYAYKSKLNPPTVVSDD